MDFSNLIQSLKDETHNFCSLINESCNITDTLKVITPEEIEDDKLDLEEVILNTEDKVDTKKQKLVDIINQAINGQATLEDIIKTSIKVNKTQDSKKESDK